MPDILSNNEETPKFSGIIVRDKWYLMLGEVAVAEIISYDGKPAVDPRLVAKRINDHGPL